MKKALYVACVVLAAFLVSTFLCQFMLIQGESMAPTYHNFQLVLVNKLSRDFHVGGVIAFRCDGLHAVLVKRIAAGPGSVVQISEGLLLVDGVPSGLYADKEIVAADWPEGGVLLDENSYFVLGDNLAESKDSRYAEVGLVQADSIVGKLLFSRPMR